MGPYLLPGALSLTVIGIFLAGVGVVQRSRPARRVSAVVFLAAWGLQLAAIVRYGLLTGSFAIDNAAEYLLALGWALLTLHLVVWIRWRVHALGLVLPPIGAVMGLAALWLLPGVDGAAIESHRGWFSFHTITSTIGMAILSLALAMSLIYVVQDRALKSKRTPAVLRRLPPLERCDRIGLQALMLGFLLLTIGIAAGVAVNADFHQRWWTTGDAKQTLPLLAWVVLAAILFSRTVLGFRGRRSAYLTIAGVSLGLLSVVGMSL